MLRLFAAIACVVLFATTFVASRANSNQWTVDFDGYGPIKIGMRIDNAEKLLGMKLKIDNYLEDESCRCFDIKNEPAISFMTDHRVIVRMDVFAEQGGPATDKGAKVGDSEASVLAKYAGRIKVGPHHYTGPEGHYLRVYDAQGKVRVIFETDGKKVTGYRVGRDPAVEYVEGCL